jgi:hypothetical protein
VRAPGTLDRLNDWLNPIVVKELRQAVRSKFILAVLLLFLVVQLVVIGVIVGFSKISGGLDALERWSGRETFMVLDGILFATCVLLIPAYTGVRLAAERSDTNVDLLFITTLSPRAIITGKLLAALVLVVLIFSAFTPFLFFTYLLRGIDVPSILYSLGLELIVIVGAIQLVIFVAVIPTNRVFRVLLGLVTVALLLFGGYMTLAGVYVLLELEIGSMLETPEFWPNAGCALTAWLGLIGLWYTWSLALLNPPSANRALVPRLFVAALWLISGAVFVAANVLLRYTFERPLPFWCLLMTLLFALQLVIAINEREEWTPRVARTIPRSWWLRVPAFLFYSGAAGGMTLAVVGYGLTLVVLPAWDATVALREWTIQRGDLDTFVPMMMTFGLYMLAYALSAVLLRRLLSHKIHPTYTWVVTVVLIGLGSAASGLAYLFLYPRWNYDTDAISLLTNPFVVFYEGFGHSWHVGPLFTLFAGIWAGIVALLNLPWFVRQVRRFQPYPGPGTAAAKMEQALPPMAAGDVATTTYGNP